MLTSSTVDTRCPKNYIGQFSVRYVCNANCITNYIYTHIQYIHTVSNTYSYFILYCYLSVNIKVYV